LSNSAKPLNTILTFGHSGHYNAISIMWTEDDIIGELRIASLGAKIEFYEFADGTVLTYDEFMDG